MENEIIQIKNIVEDYVQLTKELIQERKEFHKFDFNLELNQMKSLIIHCINNDELLSLSMDLMNAVIYSNMVHLHYFQEEENYEMCGYIHNSLLGFYIDVFMCNITQEKGATLDKLTDLYNHFEQEGMEHLADCKHYIELMRLFGDNEEDFIDDEDE